VSDRRHHDFGKSLPVEREPAGGVEVPKGLIVGIANGLAPSAQRRHGQQQTDAAQGNMSDGTWIGTLRVTCGKTAAEVVGKAVFYEAYAQGNKKMTGRNNDREFCG